MKYLRFATSSLLIGSLTLMSVGSALADTVTYDTTGPNSNNNVTITDNNSATVNNTNNVTVRESDTQTATTGNASASNNTTVGGVSSGNASNNDSTRTTVAVSNSGALGAGGSGGSVGSGGSGGSGGSVGGSGGMGGSGGTSAAGGLGGGSVLGASTSAVGGFGSGATLPVTGASVPVDVSALRSLYHPASIVPPALANHSNRTSVLFLIAAAVLSLIGAFGSAIYANRREQQL